MFGPPQPHRNRGRMQLLRNVDDVPATQAGIRRRFDDLLRDGAAGTLPRLLTAAELRWVVPVLRTFHPRWAAKTAAWTGDIRLRRNRVGGGRELALVCTDVPEEREDAVSCRKIFDAPHQDLCDAARNAVRDQIAAFRGSAGVGERRCDVCGSRTATPLVVDHVVPFARLLRDWLVDACCHDPRRAYDAVVRLPLATDAALRSSWTNFHRDRAQLRLVCVRCNGQKGVKTEEQFQRRRVHSKRKPDGVLPQKTMPKETNLRCTVPFLA